MKHILDSVHGTIDIPKEYCDKIIDSCYFQRLRRIEQNSCRSVFPCARHDRFIHSLGVYHLGKRIADCIINKCGDKGNNILPKNADVIIDTYKMACLLHDVGHTPFSHTFENFFDQDAVEQELENELGDDSFNHDVGNNKKAAPHEVISAYVAIKVFKTVLKDLNIDLVLLVRMITGYKILDGQQPNKSFENAMIELIHGDIIDADGLDYVCRDVWAGGYKNFTIDLNRLISSIEIDRNDKGEYSVLYSSKALNEIEAVLNIKNFQYLYVIKHHKVLLEQYMLVEAMKSAACYHLELSDETQDKRDNALRSLCDFKIFIEPKKLGKCNYELFCPVDDDFVVLMKLYDLDEYYIKQWFSRKYNATSLWKSKLEYFDIFRPVFKTLSENSIRNIHTLLMSNECVRFLCSEFNLTERDIIVIEVKPKVRSLNANKINILLNDSIQPYSELSHDMFSVIGEKLPFCYMYIDLEKMGENDKKKCIKKIVSKLKDFLTDNLRKVWG